MSVNLLLRFLPLILLDVQILNSFFCCSFSCSVLLINVFDCSFFCGSEEMATFELYRRSTIGMCLTETLDEMVQSGTLSPELAIQVLVQFDKVLTRFVMS